MIIKIKKIEKVLNFFKYIIKMSDLENSDDEIDTFKKDMGDLGDVDDEGQSKSKISNKKVISEYTDDTDDEDVDNDDDDPDDDDVEDIIGIKDDEIGMDNILSKDNYSTQIDVTDQYGLEIDNLSPINSEVDSDYEDELQKFDNDLTNSFINKNHPECLYLNNNEIEALSQITRNEDGLIIDSNHKTMPILTKYEKTKILGQRAKQINSGDKPYISVPEKIIDGYTIADMELRQKNSIYN